FKLNEFPAPRLDVIVEPLGTLDMLVIRANSPQDLEAAERISRFIIEQGLPGVIEIHHVPLRFADAQSVVNHLNRVYFRVNLSTTSTNLAPPRTQGTTAIPTAQGALTITPPAPEATTLMAIAVPRLNTVVIAAARARVKDVLAEIAKLDVPYADTMNLVPFRLKRAAAAQVAQQIQNFWPGRFGDPTEIRVTFDPGTNTVYVQASPGDMASIRELIEQIDNLASVAVNEVRVLALRNSLSDDVA